MKNFTVEDITNMENNSLLNKSYNEILNEIIEKLNEIKDPITGNTLNVNIDRPDDVLGVVTAYLAQALSYNNDLMIRFKNALSPLRAVGEDLNNVIDYKGLKRKKGVPSSVKVTLTRNDFNEISTIPAGATLTNKSETKKFSTQGEYSFRDGELTLNAQFICDVDGPIELQPNELVKFYGVYPSNLDNLLISHDKASVGMDQESDFDIKYRCELTTSVTGYGYLDIIDSAVMQIEGVKSCTSYAYNPDHPIFQNIPATDIVIMVNYTKDADGTIEKKIAETIFDKQMFYRGYHVFGNGTTDNQGEIIEKKVISKYLEREYTVKFMAPKLVNVFCVVKLRANSDLSRYESKCKQVYKRFFNTRVPSMIIDASEVTAEAIRDYKIPVLRTAFVVGDDKSLADVNFGNQDCYQHKLAYNEVTQLSDENIRVEVEELA